jgi:two-component system response regulator YesN
MLTVMLIDDEYIILKGMQALLDSQTEVELKICPFLDSARALEELSTIRPDVIVTDINMPEMDGLTFIEKALAQGYGGRFVIISGYEKIDYLKRAISLHVTDYLIKPLDKHKLIDLLSQIDSDRHKTLRLQLLKLKMALTLDGDLRDVALTFPENWNRLITLPYAALIAVRKLGDEATMNVCRRLETYFTPVHLLRHKELQLFLCGLAQPITAQELHAIWDAAYTAAGQAKFTPAAGVSCVHPTAELFQRLNAKTDLPLLLEAVADWALRILDPGEPVRSRCAPERLKYRFAAAVLHPQDALRIEDAFCSLVKESADLREAFVRGLVEVIAGIGASSGYWPEKDALKAAYQDKMLIAADLQGLRAALWSLPAEYYTIHTGKAEPTHSEKVEQALMYMKNHYTEDVSLRVVAEEIGLSQNYLSYVFSQEVEATFVEYLHKLRMEAACRLLENNPSLSVETISARVGYQTVGHFYKVFKNTYGKSPNQWRKQ